MPLAQIPTREHPQHFLGELEETQAIRHRGLRSSDARSHIAERQLELVHERRVRARLLDGGELLTGDVLHQPEEERIAILDVTDDRGKRCSSSCLCRSPATFSGNELETSFRPPPDHDRLKHALQADGARETGCRLRLEPTSRLPRIGVDRLDREMEQLGLSRFAQ
jgi:hypothetical protein